MQNTVILTGAGISKESGLKTFRDDDGLWKGYRFEDVATPEAFGRSPGLVHEFYNMRRNQLAEVEPNAAHRALGELEHHLGDHFTLITQNVDDLHERGGSSSRRLIHMHGEILKTRCTFCEARFPCAAEDKLSVTDECPACSRAVGMRPDIVWFGEMPFAMDEIAAVLQRCQRFVAIGTSGAVYPAAGFVRMARDAGAETVEINVEPSLNVHDFDRVMTGPATEMVPAFVDELLAD